MTKRTWLATAIALVVVTAACGSDDESGIPEPETNSPYTLAIIESESHDEFVLAGGDMVVAVNCDPEAGGLPVVTAVVEGAPQGVHVGVFEPATGVDLMVEVTGSTEMVSATQMQLDDDAYVVTFETLQGATFNLNGC